MSDAGAQQGSSNPEVGTAWNIETDTPDTPEHARAIVDAIVAIRDGVRRSEVKSEFGERLLARLARDVLEAGQLRRARQVAHSDDETDSCPVTLREAEDVVLNYSVLKDSAAGILHRLDGRPPLSDSADESVLLAAGRASRRLKRDVLEAGLARLARRAGTIDATLARSIVRRYREVSDEIDSQDHPAVPEMFELEDKLTTALVEFGRARFVENPCADLDVGTAGSTSPLRGVPSSAGAQAYLAGMLCLQGMASAPLVRTYAQAEELVDDYGAAVGRQHLQPDDDSADELESARAALVERLTREPDWRERAVNAETENEKLGCDNASWRQCARDGLGAKIVNPSDVRFAVETLKGEHLAAIEQRNECAAAVLGLRDVLARVPTANLPEDVENVVHAVLSSPRSAETEAISHAYLDEAVEARYGNKIEKMSATLKDATDRLDGARRVIDAAADTNREMARAASERISEVEAAHEAAVAEKDRIFEGLSRARSENYALRSALTIAENGLLKTEGARVRESERARYLGKMLYVSGGALLALGAGIVAYALVVL